MMMIDDPFYDTGGTRTTSDNGPVFFFFRRVVLLVVFQPSPVKCAVGRDIENRRKVRRGAVRGCGARHKCGIGHT
jgi:hypothetical protein